MDVLELQIREVEKKLGRKIFLKHPQPSPFRKDENPSFSFFVYKSMLCWIDFATMETGTYADVLEKKTLFESKWEKKERRPSVEKKPSFSVVKDVYTQSNCEYWIKKYSIYPKELNQFDIWPVKKVVFDSFRIEFTPSHPMYCYELETGVKIYRPMSKNPKWLSTASSNDIQGKQMCEKKDFWDLGILTKSLKDVVVLKKLGFCSIAPSSECVTDGPFFSYAKRKFLSSITFFDNDAQGLKSAEIISKLHGIPYIVLEKEKDPSDFVEKYGYKALEKYLEHLSR
jgi:hypothetical protein